MHRFGHAHALPAEDDRIVGRKYKTVERDRSRGRHQDQAGPGITISEEGFPRGMPLKRKVRQVIEGDSLEAPVVQDEAAWLDQIDLDPETSGKPE